MKTKNMMFRMLLMVTVLIWGGCPTFAEIVSGNDSTFTWSFDESTGTLSVNGSGVLNQAIATNYQESTIRLQIGEGITSIKDGAFSGCYNLLEITLPSTMESIDNNVFSNSYIGIIRSQREYPPTIQSNTFRTDKTFCIIAVPEYSKKLYAKADYWKDYENILQGEEKPEAITGNCGENVSYSFLPGEWVLNVTGTGDMDDTNPWNKLTGYVMEVSFSEGITRIGSYACQNMSRIKKVIVPNTVTSIGSYAFANTRLSEITLSNVLREIGSYAFSGCGFKEITLPESLESIDDYAFSSSQLQTILLPESCKSLGEHTFYYCRQLTTVQLPKTLTTIPKGIFSLCVKLSSVNLPDNLQNIEETAFSYTALEEINLPLSVTTIGSSVFEGCTSLKKVSLSANIAIIPSQTFSGCSLLREVSLPSSVKEIGSSAFSGCQSLEAITLPSSLERIDDNAFYGSGLKSISVPDNVSVVGTNVFSQSKITEPVFNNTIFIYLPREGFEEYSIPESISVVNATSFEGCSTLKNISLSNVKTIGDRAFAGCTAMTEVALSHLHQLTIGSNAFENSGLESVKLPDDILSIGAYTFSRCANLNGKIDMSNNVNLTELPAGLFADCKKLDVILLPTSILSIGADCFRNCEELENFTFPEQLSYIGSHAFENCMSIENLVFPKSNLLIGSYAFSGCINLVKASFSDGVVSINEEKIFNNCSKLEKIVFPETLNSINLDIFTGCMKVDTIYFLRETAPIAHNWNEHNLPFNSCVICVPSRSKKVWEMRGYYNPSKGYWQQDPWLEMKYAEFYENLSGTYRDGETDIAWELDTEKGDLKISGTGVIPNDGGWGKRHFSVKNVVVEGDFNTIKEGAFKDYISLEQVSLPETIEEIGDMAFACTFGLDMWNNLKSIVLPTKLKKLGKQVFSECERLEYVQIPDSLVEIGIEAFAWCHNLKEISIPRTVTSIGASAFHECYGLRNMYSHLLAPISINNNMVYNNYVNPSECTLHVHVGTKDAYLSTPGWEGFGSIVEEYADVNVSCDENGTVTGGGEYEVGSVATITAIPDEKYKFVKWSDGTSENPYKMTISKDVNLSAIFAPDTHQLIYITDGDTIAVYNLYEGDYTEIPAGPSKEGYTFMGWSEIPETMPAHDVTVTGTFSINTYTLTYMIDDVVYKTVEYEYGSPITPEPQPEGDYDTFEWTGLPETMPAHDVTVYASYTSGIVQIIMNLKALHIYGPDGKPRKELQKGLNIILNNDGTTKKVVVK